PALQPGPSARRSARTVESGANRRWPGPMPASRGTGLRCAQAPYRESARTAARRGIRSALECAGSCGRLQGVGKFDEVQVRIAQVDRADRAGGTGPPDRALDNGHALLCAVLDDLFQWGGDDEAEIRRTWLRAFGLRLELAPGRVQIDFLATEGQRLTPFAERHRLHAQHAAVEVRRDIDVGDGQDQVIEVADLHGFSPVVVRRVENDRRSFPPCKWWM